MGYVSLPEGTFCSTKICFPIIPSLATKRVSPGELIAAEGKKQDRPKEGGSAVSFLGNFCWTPTKRGWIGSKKAFLSMAMGNCSSKDSRSSTLQIFQCFFFRVGTAP